MVCSSVKFGLFFCRLALWAIAFLQLFLQPDCRSEVAASLISRFLLRECTHEVTVQCDVSGPWNRSGVLRLSSVGPAPTLMRWITDEVENRFAMFFTVSVKSV